MMPLYWSWSSYQIKIMYANNHFANRNQTILFIQPRFGYIDINGRNSRWPHHDSLRPSVIFEPCLFWYATFELLSVFPRSLLTSSTYRAKIWVFGNSKLTWRGGCVPDTLHYLASISTMLPTDLLLCVGLGLKEL